MSHDIVERKLGLLTVLIAIVISVGGLVEIVPLALSAAAKQGDVTIVPRTAFTAGGLRHLRARGLLPLPLADDPAVSKRTERYGPYSVAAESQYDHPFEFGSKRTGPDLARVGAATATTGIACICTIRAMWYRSPTCPDFPGWRSPSSTGR